MGRDRSVALGAKRQIFTTRSSPNALCDIRDDILLAQEFVAGMDYDSFAKS